MKDSVKPLANLHWRYEMTCVPFIYSMFFGVLNTVVSAFVQTAEKIANQDRKHLVQQEFPEADREHCGSKFKEMAYKGEFLSLAINVNDCVTRSKFEINMGGIEKLAGINMEILDAQFAADRSLPDSSRGDDHSEFQCHVCVGGTSVRVDIDPLTNLDLTSIVHARCCPNQTFIDPEILDLTSSSCEMLSESWCMMIRIWKGWKLDTSGDQNRTLTITQVIIYCNTRSKTISLLTSCTRDLDLTSSLLDVFIT